MYPAGRTDVYVVIEVNMMQGRSQQARKKLMLVSVFPAKERPPVPRHGAGIQPRSFRRKGRPPEFAEQTVSKDRGRDALDPGSSGNSRKGIRKVSVAYLACKVLFYMVQPCC